MSDEPNAGKLVSWSLATIVGLGLLTWGGIYVNGFFNAEREAQRTNVLQESFAYQRGMQDQLNQLYLQYQSADDAGRIGIRNVVQDQYGVNVDTSEYPAHLTQFLAQVGAR